jgi:hypothetical protein
MVWQYEGRRFVVWQGKPGRRSPAWEHRVVHMICGDIRIHVGWVWRALAVAVDLQGGIIEGWRLFERSCAVIEWSLDGIVPWCPCYGFGPCILGRWLSRVLYWVVKILRVLEARLSPGRHLSCSSSHLQRGAIVAICEANVLPQDSCSQW